MKPAHLLDPVAFWTPQAMLRVVEAVEQGRLSRAEVLRAHGLTDAQFERWRKAAGKAPKIVAWRSPHPRRWPAEARAR